MSKREMSCEEKWVKDYLVYRGFKPEDVAFEPDGNMTPDFVVEGRIAIEVRRLNQHWRGASGELVPLEKLSKPLRNRLTTLLDVFAPPTRGVSWDVIYMFRRPQLTKHWERILRDKLRPFDEGKVHDGENTIQIDKNFNVRLVRKPQPGARTFILAGGSDPDTGGWAIPELEKNLAISIAEKSQKIAPYRKRYPEWWLVLVDYVMGGTPETLRAKHGWDKVMIIHPSDYSLAYEVPNSKL